MNAIAVWTKHGEWSSIAGPWYRHATNAVAISGDYGTVGDNVRGWRKTRVYRVAKLNVGGGAVFVGSFRSIASAKAAAEKILAR